MEKPSKDQITLIRELKTRLKHDVKKLRELKASTKQRQKKGRYAGYKQALLATLKKEYRHYHIVYCLLRGKKYEQIELKCHKDNKPDFDLINEYKKEYTHIPEGVSVAA